MQIWTYSFGVRDCNTRMDCALPDRLVATVAGGLRMSFTMRSSALPLRILGIFWVSGVFAVGAPAARGSEVQIGINSIQKILQDSLFSRADRWYLLDNGPCYAYLESPRVRLENGRLVLEAHLSSRVGQRVGGYCLGSGFASDVTISAAVFGQASTLTVGDIRVDHVDDGATGDLISLIEGIAPRALPQAFNIDVLQSVRGNSLPLGGYTIAVARFVIQKVITSPKGVTVYFDLGLVAP